MADSAFLSILDDPTLFVGPHDRDDRVRRLFRRTLATRWLPTVQ